MANTAILENATEYGGIEQLYVGQFTINGLHQTHTNKSAPENGLPLYDKNRPPLPAPFQTTFSFPITHVVHSTHGKQKARICATPGKACFIAKSKGRSQACRKAFKLNYEDEQWKKKRIKQKNEYLLPGKYVWFSMKPTLPEGEVFNKDHYPVPYVNDTTFYGPWSFNFKYTKLIEAYRDQIPEDAHVVLKNGGTLVYKREVCYVVIITHSQDETHDDGNYPTILEDNASDEVPQSEDDASDEVPQPEDDASDEVPQSEDDASDEVPQSEDDASDEVPQPADDASDEVPQSEDDASDEVPQPAVNASDEVPQSEDDASDEVPQPAVDASDEVPQPAVNASDEVHVPQPEADASTNVPQPEEAEATHKELEFGNNCNVPPTFYPRCVPPPYPCPKQWNGYDWNKLGHYDHVAFAVHCDWKGSFEIVLPKGQPSCFLSDQLHDEETYCKFHPLCLPLGTGKKDNGQYYPLCYDKELEQWKKTVNTPSTPHTLESSEEAAEALPEI